jgi:AraC family transcriptional regulator
MTDSSAQPASALDALQPCNQPQPTPAIQIQRLCFPPGEGGFHSPDGHTLFVNQTTRPIHYVQTQDGKTHTGFYRQGDFTLTPADIPFFARWQNTENCWQIQLSDRFLRSVAQETFSGQGDRVTLIPTFQSRHAQIEAIATLLFTEHQQGQPGGLCI